MILALVIIVSLIFGLLLYLFFAPIYLEINSADNLYRIRLHRLASARLNVSDELPFIETSFLGIKRRLEIVVQQPAKKQLAPVKERKSKPGRQIPYKRLLNVLRSFKVNKCSIDLDLGNMPLNGMLYPAAYWLSWYSQKHIAINFVGRNEISLEIQNTLARMSWAFISSKI